MIAAQYLGPECVQPMRTAMPVPVQGEALIRVEACGICGSDLGIISGRHPRAKPPLTIGHEFCGRVVERNGGTGEIRVGDRVALYPLISCGECYVCRHGQPHVCRNLRLYGFDTDGGMAEYVKVPLRSLLKLPDSMPPVIGALLEPLAVAIHSVDRVQVRPEDTVVVMGAGPIGLLVSLVLRHLGVHRIFVTDIVDFRLDMARQLGLDAHNAGSDAVEESVRDATGGEGADVVFECAGSRSSALQMTRLARCRGAVVNVSVFKEPAPIDLQAVNFKELSLIGSRVYARQDFRKAIEIAPLLPLAQLVSHRLPIGHVAEAYRLLKTDQRVGKVLIEPGGEC